MSASYALFNNEQSWLCRPWKRFVGRLEVKSNLMGAVSFLASFVSPEGDVPRPSAPATSPPTPSRRAAEEQTSRRTFFRPRRLLRFILTSSATKVWPKCPSCRRTVASRWTKKHWFSPVRSPTLKLTGGPMLFFHSSILFGERRVLLFQSFPFVLHLRGKHDTI